MVNKTKKGLPDGKLFFTPVIRLGGWEVKIDFKIHATNLGAICPRIILNASSVLTNHS